MPGRVLIGRQPDRHKRGHLQAEHVLVVMRRARRKTVTPVGIDLESAPEVPAHETIGRGIDTGFFEDFAARGFFKRLIEPVDRPSDRLPVPGTRGTLDQQDFKRRSVDDHQHRNRNLRIHPAFALYSSGSFSLLSGSINTATKARPCLRQNSAADVSTSTRMPKSSPATSP